MALGLTRNAGSNVIPCLPCCNFVYTECGCPTNNRLNEIGQKPNINKSQPMKLVTFFIDDLFSDVSSFHTLEGRNDALIKNGAAAYSVTCSAGQHNGDFIWDFGFSRQYTPLPTGRTLNAQVRFNYASKTFDAKIILDGVDPGWSSVTKTFSNDYMATLKGESNGLTFISHSMCLCYDPSSSLASRYCPFITDAQSGEKTLYVIFSGLPGCLKSDYEINKKYVDPQIPVGQAFPLNNAELARWRINYPNAGNCSGKYNDNWNYQSIISFKAQEIVPFCDGSQLFFYFYWEPETYTGYIVQYSLSIDNLSNRGALTFTATNANSGYEVGTTVPWDLGLNYLSLFVKPQYGISSWLSTAYDMVIDYEPIFISGKIMGNNWIDNDYGKTQGQGYIEVIDLLITE